MEKVLEKEEEKREAKKKLPYVAPTVSTAYVYVEPFCAGSVKVNPSTTPDILDETDGGNLNDIELNGL